ncbi:MAG TPA: lyase family protein [Acidimicrobiales bacterium]|nr:lyase family protein [Acidimicrobiales bacterium]
MPPGSEGAYGDLFGLVLTTDALADATSDHAWLRAMLDFERALAVCEARAGAVPPDAAASIEKACLATEDFDVRRLGREGRLSGNPAVALVNELRRRLPADIARWAHFGATSQDVVDTAAALVLRKVLLIAQADSSRAAEAAAGLAGRYRDAPIAARTLLRHALPTTFGRKAAGWLLALLDSRDRLAYVRLKCLAVQLGGPAGTLSALGDQGPRILEMLASELGLAAPVLPWHTDRARFVEATAALAICAGTAAKIAIDISLLMQDEVGEVSEPAAEGRGASSSMPHKRNPAMAASVGAAWRLAQGHQAVLLGAMAQEHERAAGAWQAEADALTGMCRTAGGAVAVTADILSGLEVDVERMRSNLESYSRGRGTPTAKGAGPLEPDDADIRASQLLVDRALAYHRARGHEQ